jgi:hypothetical protein
VQGVGGLLSVPIFPAEQIFRADPLNTWFGKRPGMRGGGGYGTVQHFFFTNTMCRKYVRKTYMHMYTAYNVYMQCISLLHSVHRYTENLLYTLKRSPHSRFTPLLRKRLRLSANTGRMLPVFPLYSLSVAGSILPVLGYE